MKLIAHTAAIRQNRTVQYTQVGYRLSTAWAAHALINSQVSEAVAVQREGSQATADCRTG